MSAWNLEKKNRFYIGTKHSVLKKCCSFEFNSNQIILKYMCFTKILTSKILFWLWHEDCSNSCWKFSFAITWINYLSIICLYTIYLYSLYIHYILMTKMKLLINNDFIVTYVCTHCIISTLYCFFLSHFRFRLSFSSHFPVLLFSL